ncbi:MAG: DUF1080 domain-containing protein [Candidatus Solibacter usitatus]|nr:DUF1080 domain-containing protein [Candidatus Solibacter usitatus]
MAFLLLLAAWLPLFDGKSLTGWRHEGPRPSFHTSNSELRTSGRASAGNWIHTSAEYENFRLRFDYKLTQWAEAAVLLRAARSERPQHTGVTLVLAHDYHRDLNAQTRRWITGALMDAVEPKTLLPASYDQWHKVEIDLRGTALKASIDGTVVQDLDLSSVPGLGHRLRRGVIGFPDMGYGYALRNLELDDLGAPTKFVELTTIAGWGRRGNSGEWRAHDGVIEGMNGDSILYAPPVFQDFKLSAVVRTHDRVNSGIFLRGQPEGPNRGFEVQIYSPVDGVFQTGSVYGLRRSSLESDLEGRWFLLQIRVHGPRCTVWVDGRQTADFDQLPPALQAPGRIGLQIHSPDTRVEFRDLRIHEL